MSRGKRFYFLIPSSSNQRLLRDPLSGDRVSILQMYHALSPYIEKIKEKEDKRTIEVEKHDAMRMLRRS